MKKWKILNKCQISNDKFQIVQLIKILLENRGLTTKKEIEDFLHSKIEDVTIENVGIDKKQLQKTLSRIALAIEKKEQIVVFGDYDVDGICGSAILWETLTSLGANVLPYIPHRIDEGYGLSIKGIENVILNLFQDLKQDEMPKQVRHDDGGLIITVDNGIVAHKAVDYANEQGIDVIITDHHVTSEKEPAAYSIVHTTKLSGTGVAWVLSQEIIKHCHPGGNEVTDRIPSKDSIASLQNDKKEGDHLALVALATVADLVPLQGANRTLLTYGLKELRRTTRIGLLELFKEAALDQQTIDTYAIGHIIAPRLNAAGRLEYAMDSLRLICTNNQKRAAELAQMIGGINRERQLLTFESVAHARNGLQSTDYSLQKLIFIADESYKAGVIGLIAGRLVEEFYRPAIVLSIGETYSKASARSISGFNIIEFIRTASEHLVDAGGHPMAAGFTVETKNILVLQEVLEKKAKELLTEDMFERILKIDCEMPLEFINEKLYLAIKNLEPFGMGNPEPVFVSRNVVIDDMRIIGRDQRHVKFQFKISSEAGSSSTRQNVIEGIAFGMAEQVATIKSGDKVDIAYTINENEWNGKKALQLKIKDINTL